MALLVGDEEQKGRSGEEVAAILLLFCGHLHIHS